MAANTLVIITGYGSITPKPWKKAYLNTSVDDANQRFLKDYPHARDITAVCITFNDEFIIGAKGEISSSFHYSD